MTTYAEARRTIGASLKKSGLVGRGSVWRLSGSDVQWIAQIDNPRFGSWVNVGVGLEFGLDMTPHRASDCAVVVALENLKLVDDLSLRMALELSSTMSDEDRGRILDEAAQTLATFLHGHGSFALVAEAYRAGRFQAGFVRWDARASLENAR